MGILSLVLDMIMILLLGITIYYAMQLSRHLNVFRSGRADMERVLRDLGNQTIKAQEAISVLERAANDATDELRQHIHRAKALSDELQLINAAGDSLAERLESLASRNRTIAENLERASLAGVVPSGRASYKDAPERDSVGISSQNSFMIRDPDYDDVSGKDGDDFPAADMWGDDDGDGLQSHAEKELAEVLRRRNRF